MVAVRRRLAWVFPIVTLFGLAALQAAPAVATQSDDTSWTAYHGDTAGTGASTAAATVKTTAPAWTSPALDGPLYGEPLAFDDRVYVATENNTVVALNAATGAVVWSTHLGTPVPSSSLPCGDISPTVGITGTSVIDPSRDEIFVVADEEINGSPAHVIGGLSTTTGKVELTQSIDPPGAEAATLLQRTGLNLDQGNVVFGFGGNFGDCGSYHGWVVSVPEVGGTPKDFAVDSGAGEDQGAVWMGGAAPVVDGHGNIWVSAGNGSVTSFDHPYDDSDSVLELTPSLSLSQYFAPATWASDNREDLDFSTSPALLADGQVLIAGKSQIVYLLNANALGGIAGEETSLPHACNQVIDGGMAAVGSTVYLPCQSGIVAVAVSSSPAALSVLWSSSLGSGPPIVAGGLVWSITQAGELYGLNPTTGKYVEQAFLGQAEANHFPTPSMGEGLLLAPTATHVVAYTATSSTSHPTTTTTASSPSTTKPLRSATGPSHRRSTGGGLSGGAIAAIVVGALLVSAAVVAAVRRRRTSS